MSLTRYRAKRDFNITSEPGGKAGRSGAVLHYVIQKHDATRLHYDFRLELDGVFKSWAVPKGPSLDPTVKRLAVHVEDHPLAYGDFEGIIPPHQYGAGKVMVWDRGVWQPLDDPQRGYQKGHLRFKLEGEKLQGEWALVRMHHRPDEPEDADNWLLVKGHDATAAAGKTAEVTAKLTQSVISGRQIDEIDGPPPKRSQLTKTNQPKARVVSPEDDAAPAAKAKPTARKAKRKSTLPELLEPQLATLVNSVPGDTEAWLAEIKFDGYRMLTHIEDGQVQMFSRNGKDWTQRMGNLPAQLAALNLQNGWLDGEVVAVQADGSMSFQALQNAFADPPPKTAARLVYYLFDIPFLNNADLRLQPLVQRKKKLARLLKDLPESSDLRFSDHLQTDLGDAFTHACHHGLEGLMFKRVDSVYQEKRNRDWLKLKCQQRQEFVIGGYTNPAGSRLGFGALLLGTYGDDGKLHYAGRVGTGFDDATLQSLGKTLAEAEQKTSPFVEDVPPRERAHVHWVRPEQVAEIRFAEWTEEKRLRQAAFLGLRKDKPAQQVVPEVAIAADAPVAKPGKTRSRNAEAKAETTAPKPKRSTEDAEVGGVRISHPTRIVFPGTGDTKVDLARYYEQVADWLVPQLKDRPLTLVRCPQGAAHACFFQKHLTDTMPEGVQPVEIKDESGSATYMLANDVRAVIQLVQSGVLELHTWGATQRALEQPDRMIFDLDPAPDVSWQQVVEAAQLLRGLLQEAGLGVFLKTTGGKGLHVEVPLKPGADWDTVKAFSKAVATHLAQQLPDRFIATMSKAKRNGKIFIDYLRNARGATAVAAYSTRARDQAGVATPIAWDELPTLASASFWTIHNVPERLAAMKHNPWADYDKARVKLGPKIVQKFGI
ncbi:DNA ligase D [Amantichitinum ursilacus]|uniref:DNA ligase (ATP) n=1 Tax=Amantichitinum ursilacus TaxID=857265 RepID=A0A0N0GQM7_9NEIS|nr:DNA ligase D [Amantichitinum ursilacus]KPC54780.1 putative ATP-dependent DNA ligase YkoU [Amantichitinum ursilacus]